MNFLKINNKSIAYNRHIASKKKAPCIIFHHGFMSDMNGSKAIYLEKYCREADYHYIRFDNYGCGQSSGNFFDQTISSWLEGANYILTELTDDKGPVILAGSSLGAWISVLSAITNPNLVQAIVTIAAAFDFTEEIIWNNLSSEAKLQLQNENFYEVTGKKNCGNKYPISFELINDARKHLLLNKQIMDIGYPVHLIHGMQDADVSYTISQRAFAVVKSENAVLKLIKDGDHKLSRPGDLQIIANSITEIVDSYL